MRPSLGDRNKCCTPPARPSVRLTVRPVLPIFAIFSKQESCKNIKFSGKIVVDKSN